MANNYLDLEFEVAATVTPAEDSIPRSPEDSVFIADGWLSPNIARTSDIVPGDGLTEDPTIHTSNFTAVVNHSYWVSSTNAVSKMVTLPASAADGDKIRIRDYGGGADTLSINPNGGAINWADSSVSLIRTFTSLGFDVTLTFRSIAEGGQDRWQASGSDVVQYFGDNPVPLANAVIVSNDDAFAGAVACGPDQFIGRVGSDPLGAYDLQDIVGGALQHGVNHASGTQDVAMGKIHYVLGTCTLNVLIPVFPVLEEAPRVAVKFLNAATVTITVPTDVGIQDPVTGAMGTSVSIFADAGTYYQFVARDNGEGECDLLIDSQFLLETRIVNQQPTVVTINRRVSKTSQVLR